MDQRRVQVATGGSSASVMFDTEIAGVSNEMGARQEIRPTESTNGDFLSAWITRSVALILTLALAAPGGCASRHAKTADPGDSIPAPENGKLSYYVFFYHPGPKWRVGKSVREQPVFAHATYMNKLEREGTLLLGGPFKDDSGAFGVLQCEDLEAARKIVDADPAIRDQLMTAEVHPWFPAAPGCLEPKPW